MEKSNLDINVIIVFIVGIFLFSGLLLSNQLDVVESGDEKYILWQFGDMKLSSKFPEAIKDMNNLPFDDAIVVGDMVEPAEISDYEKYLQIMEGSNHGFEKFHHLAGNHEYQCRGTEEEGCLNNYKNYIDERLFYTFDRGNIHFIVLSTDKTEWAIKDSTFDWLENEVNENQNKILIIASHQPPHLFSFGGDMTIDKLLAENNVDLWIFGHTHCKHGDSKCSRHGAKGDFYIEDETTFVDTGEIIENSESRYYIFKNNSDNLIIKSRNHETSSFQDEFEHIIKLRRTFKNDI